MTEPAYSIAIRVLNDKQFALQVSGEVPDIVAINAVKQIADLNAGIGIPAEITRYFANPTTE